MLDSSYQMPVMGFLTLETKRTQLLKNKMGRKKSLKKKANQKGRKRIAAGALAPQGSEKYKSWEKVLRKLPHYGKQLQKSKGTLYVPIPEFCMPSYLQGEVQDLRRMREKMISSKSTAALADT